MRTAHVRIDRSTDPCGTQHVDGSVTRATWRGTIALSLQDVGRILKARWMSVVITTVAVVLGAIVYTLLTTPLYMASTRLFVSTTAGASANDLYQGNRLSQDRVLSYTELLKGRTLAQRTVDKLGLDTTAEELSAKVTASAKPDTVLIDVQVRDDSPVKARDIANALSDEFVNMVRELETPKPGASPDARVIVEQRAFLPTKPVIPNPPRNIWIGMVLGLMLGIGVAVLRDALDNTVNDRETLEQITGVGIVGNIPLDKERRNTPAISFDKDNSAIAESFRKLRTNLQFLAVDHPPRSIVITSSVPNEGKSTTAINLALALAEGGSNVVLVDGDMRRPSLHIYLDLIGSAGFSTVLSGAATPAEALQKTQFENLWLLAAGPTPPNPSELLGSLAAKTTLAALRSEFDFVIVDSSPQLAVTDGAILAANADGVLLIVRHGQTKREQLQRGVEHLNDVGALILGTVSTMEPMGRAGSSYYRYQYYGYGESRSDSHAGSGRRGIRRPSGDSRRQRTDDQRLDVNETRSADPGDS